MGREVTRERVVGRALVVTMVVALVVVFTAGEVDNFRAVGSEMIVKVLMSYLTKNVSRTYWIITTERLLAVHLSS